MPDASVHGSVGSWLATRKLSAVKDPRAAIALALAEAVDDPEQSASGRAAAAKQLDVILTALATVAQPVKGDGVDDVAARRAARRATW